jgi:hypothetical protein
MKSIKQITPYCIVKKIRNNILNLPRAQYFNSQIETLKDDLKICNLRIEIFSHINETIKDFCDYSNGELSSDNIRFITRNTTKYQEAKLDFLERKFEIQNALEETEIIYKSFLVVHNYDIWLD